MGGLITRIIHASLAQHPHRAWLYVDDLLAALLRTSAQDSLLILVLLLSSIGAPTSWKKAYVGDSLIWCGWKGAAGTERPIDLGRRVQRSVRR